MAGLPLFTVGAYLTGKYVFSKQPEERPFLDRGPYHYVRHPIYLSFLLIGSGFILLALNYVALPLVLFLTAFTYPRPEEAELVKLYGERLAGNARQLEEAHVDRLHEGEKLESIVNF